MCAEALMEPQPVSGEDRPPVSDRHRILIACDRPRIGRLLRRLIEEEGYEVDEADRCEALVHRLVQRPYDLILIDLPLGPVSNFSMLHLLWRWKQANRVPVLICGGVQALEAFAQHVDAPLPDVILKPCSKALLLARIALALDHRTGCSFLFPERRAVTRTPLAESEGSLR
ncbi:MAG: response regulator [Planctomycetes bacterium]|nr:response regulator [Planctomycetota bacterium]